MAYSPSNHQAFSRRMQKFIMNFQSLRQEAAVLVGIYHNETEYGASDNWVDTEIATAAEHVDAVVLCQTIEAMITNGAVETADRSQWLTPFLQSE